MSSVPPHSFAHKSIRRRQVLAWGGGLLLASCTPSPLPDLSATDQTAGTSPSAAGDPELMTDDLQTESTTLARVRLGITDRIRTLDPADAYEPAALNILANIGETLYTSGPNGALVPQLATDLPTISEDGLSYTIPLREGVRFHDGESFDAAAMAFSLTRFMESGGRPAFLLSEVIESVTASGPLTLTITLQAPFSGFGALLSFPGACAVSPAAYESGLGSLRSDQVVASGPYRLVAYSENSRLVLDAFEEYWGEAPQNSGVDVQFYNTGGTLLNALRTGAVDLAFQTLEPSQVESLVQERNRQGWQVIQRDSGQIRYLVLNVTQAPLDQVEVRQAIAAAVDRVLLQERVFLNQASPLYSLVPESVAGSRPTFLEAYGEHNVQRARTLLTQAGFSADNPARTTLWHTSDNPRAEMLATTLKASLEADLGGLFELELRSVEVATLLSNLNRGPYPMVLLSWSPDFLDADNYLQPFLPCATAEGDRCTAGSTFEHGSFYDNPELTELVAQQRRLDEPSERNQVLLTIQQTVAQEVPFIPLLQGVDYAFGGASVAGLSLNPAIQAIPLWRVAIAPDSTNSA